MLTSDQAYSASRALKAILMQPSTLHISCERHLCRPFTDRELLSGLWFVSNTMAFQILALPSARRALNIASLLSEGVEKKMDLWRDVSINSRIIFISLCHQKNWEMAKCSKIGIRYNNTRLKERKRYCHCFKRGLQLTPHLWHLKNKPCNLNWANNCHLDKTDTTV